MNRKTIFKKVSVLALALSMTMTTSAYTLVMPVLASEETTLKTEVQITDLTVKSGLKKNGSVLYAARKRRQRTDVQSVSRNQSR